MPSQKKNSRPRPPLLTSKRFLALILMPFLVLPCGCKSTRADMQIPTQSPEPLAENPIIAESPEKISTAIYNEPYIFFINVGKADSALICIDGKRFLIDTGTEASVPLLFGALNILGVDSIDGVFLTHTHKDHIGGFPALAEYYPVKQVYMGEFSLVKKDKENPIAAAAQNAGVPLTVLKAGETVPISDTAFFDVLAPIALNEDDDNDNSLVLRLECQNTRALFTGDMQFAQEQTLLEANTDLRADILKIANHGNPDASGEDFIHAVSPALAVISTDTDVDTDSANERVLQALSQAETVLTQDHAVGVGIALQSNGVFTVFSPVRTPSALKLSVSVDVKTQTVMLKNEGEALADISACVLLSERGGEFFRFPDGATLSPGESCTVGGAGSGCEYEFPVEASPWSKKKDDMALIYDQTGNLLCRSD